MTGEFVGKFLDAAIVEHLGGGFRPRLPGFHCSSSGKCHREVVLSTFLGIRKPFDDKSKKILGSGTKFHEILDEATRKFVPSTKNIIQITPHMMRAFATDMVEAYTEAYVGHGIEMNEVHKYISQGVIGECDALFIDMKKKTAFFLDYKSAGFGKYSKVSKKGAEADAHTAMQLGAYLGKANEPGGILHILDVFGITDILSCVVYVARDGFDTSVIEVDVDNAVDDARLYWREIAAHSASLIISNCGIIPDPVPPAKWWCNYCGSFSGIRECSSITQEQLLEARG